MDSVFPAPDYDLSPHTGWTRAHWEAMLARMTYGFAQVAERSGSPARVLYPDDRRGLPDAVDGIESFARIGSAWGAWLRNPSNPSSLSYHGHEMDIEALLRQGLLDGTNPSNPATYWGDIGHMDQRIVESADIAVTLWLSRERVFDRMPSDQQAQVIAWLAQVDGKGTYTDNWILFTAMAQAVRRKLGFDAPEDDLDFRLLQIGEFYRGDGWYVDGPSNEFELYNAWMFGWHYLLWCMIDGDRRPEHREQVLQRARSFIAGFLHFFGANGSYPSWGRSLVYRFAALAPFALGHMLQIAPPDPGLLRRVSSGCLRYFHDRGTFDPLGDYVQQGYHGDFPPAGEAYISPGSPYWCCHGLFALTLDRDDPFWTAKESPLPVERDDFELVLPAPGFVLSGRKSTGQVLLLNSRSGPEYDAPRHNYTTKYGKLAYSTHFPFNVLPTKGAYAPDGMISLTRDGTSFGHRLHTRAGAAAPGFIWSKFDEVLNGEPQPMWVAVLLWGDVQVRMAVVRPTFPVVAYEAPGALGTDQPRLITRRSDQGAGWEYAEAEGRAVSIQRLLGYDHQNSSAPFLDQSNTNLAYGYCEQPVIREANASAAARCLASASLVRPAAFDPAVEFADIRVEIEYPEIFHVHLPGGGRAIVAPGETTPGRITLNGIEMEGRELRFAFATDDLKEISGLGLTRIAGVAEFAGPATFRLHRSDEGVCLTTNTAVEFMPEWLGGPTRRVMARTVHDEWFDISDRCPANTIPLEIVHEWSERSQRTLVDFWIRA